MSALDFFTWAAIGVLIAGSAAVFVWFLRDVGRLYRHHLPPPDQAGTATGDDAAPSRDG